MSKDIKEFIHYYWNTPMMAAPNHSPTAKSIECMLLGIPRSGTEYEMISADGVEFFSFGYTVKPILRKLESMEEDEAIELAKFVTDPRYHKHIQIFQIKPNKIDFMDGTMWQGDGVEEYNDCEILFNYLSAAQFHYLLSRGFWLFGDDWFDEGLIIDKNTLS